MSTQKLTILVNGQPQLTYDRALSLPQQQRDYLDGMDRKMDAGVELDAEWINAPDIMQRARFVAVHLVYALQKDNEPLIAASCAWLADRVPELKQVVVQMKTDGFSIELISDRHYIEEVPVSFTPRLLN